MSVHGKVKEYTLTPEELKEVIEKYGPPKEPLRKSREKIWEWQRITKSRYKRLQVRGENDFDVCRRFNIHRETLIRKKREWGIIK